MIMTRNEFMRYLHGIHTMSRDHNWPQKIIPDDPTAHFDNWLKVKRYPEHINKISATLAVHYFTEFNISTVPDADQIYFTEVGFECRGLGVINMMP